MASVVLLKKCSGQDVLLLTYCWLIWNMLVVKSYMGKRWRRFESSAQYNT